MGQGTRLPLLEMSLERFFPKLAGSDYRITSPRSAVYNCIAWAIGDSTQWWWPDELELAYWPEHVPREETLEAFHALMLMLGFEPCENANLEANFDKVALYTKGQQPTHAAGQLETGIWTSKLGPLEDIEHNLDDLVGDCYGIVALVFRRPRRETGKP